MRSSVLFLLLASMVATVQAGQFSATVIAVLDGDTVMVLRNSGPAVKVRLADIDAPEKDQPGGIESTRSLSELVLHKQVILNTRATDTYGRLVAHLEVGGNSVNEEQVRRGMAWAAVGWRRSRLPAGIPITGERSGKIYIELQSEAQRSKRGLWSGAGIMEPSQWRKQHATDAPATPLRADPAKRATADYTCGSKHHCSQMRFCDEAYFYLNHCGVKSLDPNRDGIPCEHLCGEK